MNRNSGIFTLIFHGFTAALTLYGGKTILDPALWIKVFMALSGLNGLNLVLTAQTMPVDPSTSVVLKALGSTATLSAAAVLSQIVLFDGLSQVGSTVAITKAFGVLMAVFGVTSLPVWLDLRKVGARDETPANLFVLSLLLSLGSSYFLLK